MKSLNWTSTLSIFFFPISIFGQITIVDYSEQIKKVVPYDTSYFINNVKFTNDEVLIGLVGHHLTMLSPERLYTSKVRNNTSIGFFKEEVDDLKFGTFKILKVEKIDYQDCFLLGNEKDTFYYKVEYSSNDYIINEGFDKLKQNLINQDYFAFNEESITGIDGVTYNLVWGEKLKIVNVEIGKISNNDFGVVFKFKGSTGELKLPLKLNDTWFEFGGDPEGSITFNITSPENVLGKSVKILNEKLFRVYMNSTFKNDIKSGTLKAGMSKEEILLFLGRPFSNLSVPGYDDVWVYGSGSNSFKILFKGSRSVKVL